jgi:hypothetical protein
MELGSSVIFYGYSMDILSSTPTGWWLTYPSEKYAFVNGKDDIPYIMENKKCSKPPLCTALRTALS